MKPESIAYDIAYRCRVPLHGKLILLAQTNYCYAEKLAELLLPYFDCQIKSSPSTVSPFGVLNIDVPNRSDLISIRDIGSYPVYDDKACDVKNGIQKLFD